jgi:hypothetical protein
MVDVARRTTWDRGGAGGHDDVDLLLQQLRRHRGKTLVLGLCPSDLEHEVLALLVAEIAQARAESIQAHARDPRGAGVYVSDPRDLRRTLLCARRERAGDRADQKSDEHTPARG